MGNSQWTVSVFVNSPGFFKERKGTAKQRHLERQRKMQRIRKVLAQFRGQEGVTKEWIRAYTDALIGRPSATSQFDGSSTIAVWTLSRNHHEK